jgi:hypothetical protein
VAAPRGQGEGKCPPPIIFCPAPSFCPPQKIISHWERLHHYSLVNARIHEIVFSVSTLVCKSLNGKTCQLSNNKSFSLADLNSQTCKALIRWKYHEIFWTNHVAYMAANILKGGRYSLEYRPLLRGGRISWGGESPVTAALANISTFLEILSCPPPPQIWVCPSNAQSPKILRPGAATGPCHTNVVFSVIRVVRCCQFPYSVIGCS